MRSCTLIVVPAFNEEAALPQVLTDLHHRCPDFDILVVDDGSSDRTAEVARAQGVLVAQLPYNLGIGGALRTGFRYAVSHRYEQAVQFDADGQHEPAELHRLLEALDEGADLAVGSRFGQATVDYSVSRVRWGAMRLLRLAVRLLSGRSFTDTSSGFRAFSRPMLEFFARTYPLEYMDSVEALLLACYARFRVVEVPTRMRQRSAGVPSTNNIRLAYHYLRLLVAIITTTPLGRRRLQGVAA